MLKALAFLPHDEVSEYYNQFYSTLEDEDTKQFCSWFERNYIARDNSQPKYPPKFWSVHNESNIAFPRTQNSIEAWHRRLKVIVGKRNSGLYKLINDLKGELVCAKAQLAKIQNGHKISQTKKAVKANNRIKRITKKRLILRHVSFLKRIAKNLII